MLDIQLRYWSCYSLSPYVFQASQGIALYPTLIQGNINHKGEAMGWYGNSTCPLQMQAIALYRERKNLFFSNFSGTSGISPQNPGISCKKVWFPWFRGTYGHIPNFSAPTPSRGIPPPKDIWTKKFGFGFLFLSDYRGQSQL